MIKFNNYIVFTILISGASMVFAGSYNSVKINDHIVKLSNDKIGYITVDDMASGKVSRCKISNWSKRLSKGAGMISLTSDEIGLLLYPGKNYLKTSEVLHCDSNPINLYSIPDFDGNIDSVIDVNFEKKIYLSLYLIDVDSSIYQAKVAYFGDKNNLLTGKGFWSDVVKKVNATNDAFPVSDDFYIGKISANGMYVAPNDLDCSVNSFPVCGI
ncbi:hypothetical protein O3W44_17890 [Pantoea sp. LMR881]|uniref:hypothetical protein n=1 Tax=Pantoea sp. LMR881 TaxID=3014336 RepID=UPI0022AF51C7|nr:hypothetical protein [Pantoea sp. LMR881]MCZ4060571.1 hypothetical protein [Pantoea sp. LMR881]